MYRNWIAAAVTLGVLAASAGCQESQEVGKSARGLFAGESMFSRETDASKVAQVHLVERLRRGGYTRLDSQYIVGTHMLQFGTIEISRAEYKRKLRAALARFSIGPPV